MKAQVKTRPYLRGNNEDRMARRLWLWQRDYDRTIKGARCRFCLAKLADMWAMNVVRIDPRFRFTRDNIAPACAKCTRSGTIRNSLTL